LVASIGWAYYSWMLAHPSPESAPLRSDWAAFLLAQIAFGLLGALACASLEWGLAAPRLVLGWPLAAALGHSAGAALLVGVLSSLLARAARGRAGS
jgi:heme A synthase